MRTVKPINVFLPAACPPAESTTLADAPFWASAPKYGLNAPFSVRLVSSTTSWTLRVGSLDLRPAATLRANRFVLADGGRALYVPVGLGHAFLSLGGTVRSGGVLALRQGLRPLTRWSTLPRLPSTPALAMPLPGLLGDGTLRPLAAFLCDPHAPTLAEGRG
ncbi:hypothetical protein GCM10020221_36330 [Streptomyces thioluteus]|uniref:Uncharacterized protein n=1 Tax=Streptomyces thioluteus TaxID=66431 RepID=A0ABN3X708_STRTU